ncbi:HEPN domain-containing protein [Halorarius litoreus]|uniref:HEPN domain-containing protein n=1 Tax=Halorarius litoreus TaxID=2962676 RepID=UPI0020CE9128|nr:HEPN domain-containing protein [Halorarius litoreus]
MTDLGAEVRDAMREATRSYIEQLSEQVAEIPSGTYLAAESGFFTVLTEEGYPRPSLLLEDDIAVEPTPFEDVAGQIADALEVDIEPTMTIDEEGNGRHTHHDLHPRLVEACIDFAGLVMDYAGDVTFSEEAFATAYEENFEPRLSDRPRYTILVPMWGISFVDNEQVTLDADTQFDIEFEGPYTVTGIEIGKPNTLEQNGMATFAKDAGPEPRPSLGQKYTPDYLLRIELSRRGTYREFRANIDHPLGDERTLASVHLRPNDRVSHNVVQSFVDDVIDTLECCLRLLYPFSNPEFEGGYVTAPGPLRYRDLAVDVVNQVRVDRRDRDGDVATLDASRIASLETFWAEYANRIASNSGEFHRPLERYNDMYERDSVEDAVLDCIIAIENLLLNDVRGSSYSFRIGLRSGILLEGVEYKRRSWSKDEVYRFMQQLYGIRGDIVHENQTVAEIIEAANHDPLASQHPATIQEYSRQLLSRLLTQYLKYAVQEGISPQDLNTEIDRIARSGSLADWDLS